MSWLKQNWIKIGLVILILGVFIFVKEWRNSSPDTVSNIASTKNGEEDEFDVAKVRELYANWNKAAIAELEDREMADYITNVILVKCPFYEPDGASYRICLDGLREKAESAYNGSELDYQKVKNVCSELSSNYSGLKAGEMYRNCLTYNFSNNE